MHGMVQEVVKLKHEGKTAEAEQRYSVVCQTAEEVVALLTTLETHVTQAQPQGRAMIAGH